MFLAGTSGRRDLARGLYSPRPMDRGLRKAPVFRLAPGLAFSTPEPHESLERTSSTPGPVLTRCVISSESPYLSGTPFPPPLIGGNVSTHLTGLSKEAMRQWTYGALTPLPSQLILTQHLHRQGPALSSSPHFNSSYRNTERLGQLSKVTQLISRQQHNR